MAWAPCAELSAAEQQAKSAGSTQQHFQERPAAKPKSKLGKDKAKKLGSGGSPMQQEPWKR